MDTLLVFILLFGIYFLQRKGLVAAFGSYSNGITDNYFDILFFVHIFFTVVYLIYAYVNRSDSGEYYRLTTETSTWGELFEKGTPFVKFICYPFSNLLGLSYTAVMLVFSFVGFEGMLFFYLAARENVHPLPLVWGGMTILELLFILPNSHFWSASLGKGSLMTFSIGLIFYGLSRFNRRLPILLIGAFLVYMIRSHLLLAVVIGVGLGVFFTQKGIKWYFRLPLIFISIVTVFFISDNVVESTGTESLNIFDSKSVEYRAKELAKGGSGVDIGNYGHVFKLFTFLFRPLFIDSPGLLGVVSSFENAFLLFLAVRLLFNFPVFWSRSTGFHKSAFFIFFLAAISLAQVTGNLGIAIRQKSQIFPLFFLIYAFSYSVLNKPRSNP